MDIICMYIGKALNITAGTRNKAFINLQLFKGADINDTCGAEDTTLYLATGKLNLKILKV